MMKRSGALVLAVAALATLIWNNQGATEPVDGVRRFMRPKLDHAQKVLEGLTLEDFNLIREHGKALMRLSEAAEWQVLPGPEYVRHSEDFQRRVSDMIVAANKENIDAATLAYVQLTMNCVQCHKHVREAHRVAVVPTP